MSVRQLEPVLVLRRALLSAAMLVSATSLAPAAVEINSKPTVNMSCSRGVCRPTAKKAVLNMDDLAGMLASGDVMVKSTKQNQDIEVDAKLGWGNAQLVLDSYRSIVFDKSISVSSGGLKITTNDGGSGGDFRFSNQSRVKFSNLHSNLTINGNRYALAKTIGQIKKLVHRGSGERYVALADNIDATQYRGGPLPFAPVIFEGLGNVISNLTINDSRNQEVGLFAGAAAIRDLGLVNVNITGSGSNQAVGAIAGETGGPVIGCYSTGGVSATGPASSAGGLIGGNLGTVTNSYSTVSVSVTSGSFAGGLVGWSEAGNQGEYTGSIQGSYATGAVTGGDGAQTGGLIGINDGGSVSNSYATGAVVSGSNGTAGGLIGQNENSDSANPTLTASYSTGNVSGGSGAMLGGLIGQDLAQTGTSSSYWDLDTSGIDDTAQGAGNVPNDPGITGLSDAQFKSGLPAGFDTAIWKEKAKLNSGYPYLIDNAPPKAKD